VDHGVTLHRRCGRVQICEELAERSRGRGRIDVREVQRSTPLIPTMKVDSHSEYRPSGPRRTEVLPKNCPCLGDRKDPRMTEALATEFAVSEPLTWKQICERHPKQWVVLVEIERDGSEDHSTRFRTARIAGAGKTLREALDQGRPFERGYSGCASPFTGPITRSIAHLFR
jgi:hypothetical protein